MKAGEYYTETLPEIMCRTKAMYEYERDHNKNPYAYYPFGYEGAYTAATLRTIIEKALRVMKTDSTSIDVVFSPTYSEPRKDGLTDWEKWRRTCQKGNFPTEFDMSAKAGTWCHMDRPVRGSTIFPAHYPETGDKKPYYGLLIEDLELFTSPTREIYIDLSLYRRLSIDGHLEWTELDGRQWILSAIPCLRVKKPASVIKTEPVVGLAKSVEPYGVRLSPIPFEAT